MRASAIRENRTHEILNGPIATTILRLSLINIPFVAVQIGAQIAEAWYVSELGIEALASIALVYPILILMQMMSAGAMGGAINSAIARAIGAGEIDRAANLAIHSLFVALLGAVLFQTIMLGHGAKVLDALGATDLTRPGALTYAGIVFLGAPSVWLLNTLASIARGTGAISIATAGVTLAFSVQITLGASLTLGLGPFPNLGIAGAAYGHFIGFTLGTIFLSAYILSGHTGLPFLKSKICLRLEYFWDILKVGLIALTSPVMNVATVLTATILVTQSGTEALAGYGLGARLELLMVPVVFGIGTVLTTIVATNVGAGNWKRAHNAALIGGVIAGILTGSVGVVCFIVPETVLGLFTDNQQTIEAGSLYMAYVGPAYFFLGLGLSIYFASLGAKQTRYPTFAVAARLTIILVSAFLIQPESLKSIFLCISVSIIMFGLLNLWGLKQPGWKRY